MRTWLLVCAGILLAGSTDKVLPEKKLGREWTPDDSSGSYQRSLVAKAIRFSPGYLTRYELKTLGERMVHALESDDGRVYEVGIDGDKSAVRGKGAGVGRTDGPKIRVTDDERGIVAAYRVQLEKVIYSDLDGDGMIDTLYDGRADRHRILLEGRFVDVESSRNTLEARGVRSLDRQTVYIFEKGAWKVRQ